MILSSAPLYSTNFLSFTFVTKVTEVRDERTSDSFELADIQLLTFHIRPLVS